MSHDLMQSRRGLQLDRVVLLGRTFEEYRRYFLLEPDSLVGKKILDVAGGVGRHSIWLAQRGWRVKLLDISEVGIQQAEENAKHTGTAGSISSEIRDLNSMQDLGREQYDLVIVFFFLQRKLFPALLDAIKPGGILIYKTYTTEQKNFAGGPSHPMFLLEPNELLHAFSSLRVLHYHETVQEKGVAELVARK